MKPGQRHHSPTVLARLVVLSCWLALPVQAQPRSTPALSPALQVPGAANQSVRSYTPKAGETLDHVIANTLSDSPLKIDLLRQAYIEHNPSAFSRGKVPQLRKGVTLTVPDTEQLRQKYLLALPGEGAAQHSAFRSSNEERRRWVQYP